MFEYKEMSHRIQHIRQISPLRETANKCLPLATFFTKVIAVNLHFAFSSADRDERFHSGLPRGLSSQHLVHLRADRKAKLQTNMHRHTNHCHHSKTSHNSERRALHSNYIKYTERDLLIKIMKPFKVLKRPPDG